MIHENILRYRGGRYAWWALGLIVLSVAIYATQGGRQRPGGGTWQGYVLGTAAVLLIVWLTLLGVRKRRYSSNLGSVQGWTSAHVWLGLALLLVATLHCAGHFGWNVHTLAYVLMCAVILSGIFGLYVYLSTPRQLAANSDGRSRAALFAELFDLDRKGRELAKVCDPGVNIAVKSSIERTSIGGGVWRQLLAVDHSLFMRADSVADAGAAALVSNADQQGVIDQVAQRVPQAAKRAEAGNLQALIVLLCRRQAVLRRIRRDIQLQGWLRLWLYIHVPLTFALLAALIVHIMSTFMYW
jgi:multisubunit Na+/H+ antiporter MnhB subunit